MKSIILSVDGMTCSACSNGLENIWINKTEFLKQMQIL